MSAEVAHPPRRTRKSSKNRQPRRPGCTFVKLPRAGQEEPWQRLLVIDRYRTAIKPREKKDLCFDAEFVFYERWTIDITEANLLAALAAEGHGPGQASQQLADRGAEHVINRLVELAVADGRVQERTDEHDKIVLLVKKPDIRRLYNVACAEDLTRGSEDLTDQQFEEYMAGNKTVMEKLKRYSKEDEWSVVSRRLDPKDTVFTEDDDKYISALWRKEPIWVIALKLKHNNSETAVMWRARHLTRSEKGPDGKPMPPTPLRRAAHGFPLDRVLCWLGLEESEVPALEAAGVKVVDKFDLHQRGIKERWVEAESLAPFIEAHGKRLIAEKNADKFFLLEILETEREIRQRRKEGATQQEAVDEVREACYWLEHGHRCAHLELWTEYGLYCHGQDMQCAYFSGTAQGRKLLELTLGPGVSAEAAD